LDLQQVPIKLDNKGKPKAEYGSGYLTTNLPFPVVELTRQKVLDAGYNVSGVVGMVKQKRMKVYKYYKTQTSGGGSNINRKPEIESPNRKPKSKP